MPKFGSDALTTDHCHRLSLSYLRKEGVLRAGSETLILLWGKGRRVFISFEELNGINESYLHVQYLWQGTPRNYWLELVPVVSPISFPHPARYLLVCPVSALRVTTLYLHPYSGELLCREAWSPGRLYYPSQLVSERFRYWARQQAEDDAQEKADLGRPRRKLWYKGKPTRQYAALLNLQKQLGYPPPIMDCARHRTWVKDFWLS